MTLKSDVSITWEDYVRAEGFLAWNTLPLVFNAQVRPNWIEKNKPGETPAHDRFWYLNQSRNGQEFVLVDPERKTRELAFDHVRLAAALSAAAGTPFEPFKLPFKTFEFVEEGRAIQFDAGEKRWTCDLETYHCSGEEKKAPPAPGERR